MAGSWKCIMGQNFHLENRNMFIAKQEMKMLTKDEQKQWLQTHPCSVFHSSPLLGYTTQLMSGLSSDPADSSSGATSAGEQQLTPTATSCGDRLAICTTSVNGLPSDMHFPSWQWFCTKRESFWCTTVNDESSVVMLLSSSGYLTREGEPGFRVGKLPEQLDQSFRLFDTRDCFKSYEISSCSC